MNAKEMFANAKVKFIREDKFFIEYLDQGVTIVFDKKFKTVDFVIDTSDNEDSRVAYVCETDVLMAIFQQIKELGWELNG